MGTFLFVQAWVHNVLDFLSTSLCFCVVFKSVLTHWKSFELIWLLSYPFTTYLSVYTSHRGSSRVHMWVVVHTVTYALRFSVNMCIHPPLWLRYWCWGDFLWVVSVAKSSWFPTALVYCFCADQRCIFLCFYLKVVLIIYLLFVLLLVCWTS